MLLLKEARGREFGEMQGRLNAALLAAQLAEKDATRLHDEIDSLNQDLVRGRAVLVYL